MRSRIFRQLIKQISNEQTKKKETKRYGNVYNIALFLLIALADKGYISNYKVTVSAIAKILTKLGQVARLIAQLMLDSNLLFSLLSRTHEMFFNQLADQIFLFSTLIFNFALSWVSQLHSQVAIFVLINSINVSYTGSYAYSQLICLGRYVIKMLIQCSGSSVSCENFVADNPSPNQLVNFKTLLFIQQEKKQC